MPQQRVPSVQAEIFIANTDADIMACFPVYSALRPALQQAEFLARVRLQQAESFQILALRHAGELKSVAGFRIAHFMAWGKVLYLDDLSTLPGQRGQGWASQLLDWLIAHAQALGCDGLHLDTGYARHAAHRVYLQKGLQLNCHHLALSFHAPT